jgi:hypothetical protein
MTQTHCPACAHPWTEHPGLATTCVRLQNALAEIERLRQALEAQRNAFIVTAQSANLTTRKARDLMNRDYEVSGIVLLGPDNRRAIVEMSAVRCISNSEMWALMHPAADPLPEGEGPR